jgi:SAM-dependent MidA family methyltransferase
MTTPAAVLSKLLERHAGRIPLDRFMHEALYNKECGYYTCRASDVGRHGDFATSVSLDPAMGSAIAAWAMGARDWLPRRRRWHLIEIGGGGGQLAAQIRRSIPRRHRFGLRYHIVEVSPALQAVQQRRLGRRAVRWHTSVESALDAAEGAALMFSNELVDAFPCKQLVRGQHEWLELHLELRDGDLVECLEPLTDPGIAPGHYSGLAALEQAAVGHRFEIHPAYNDWLAGWLPRLTSGGLLTIDYGDKAAALRTTFAGSLRGHFRHQHIHGPEVYQRFTYQDLTADVNFTDLQNWGEQAGLTTGFLITQQEFLERFLLNAQEQATTRPTLAFLMHPAGAGSAFKALEQFRPR